MCSKAICYIPTPRRHTRLWLPKPGKIGGNMSGPRYERVGQKETRAGSSLARKHPSAIANRLCDLLDHVLFVFANALHKFF